MFAALPASRPRRESRLPGGVFAAWAHGAVIAVAVWASTARAAPPRVIKIIDLDPPIDDRPPERGPIRIPPIPDCVDCDFISRIRVEAPPGTIFDRLPDTGPAMPGGPVGSSGDPGLGGNGVVPIDFADQPPEVLAGPPLAYPQLLRQAGIQGRVVVRAVVDTLGRVEEGSASIVASANPGFDGPALAYVRRARFRPARVLGRAVRVLVEVPIDFRIVR